MAAALYSLAAWAVRPGFYDGPAAPFYAYVSPPPVLALLNVAPTKGSGVVGVGGGKVTTHDQPIAQAAITIPQRALTGPTPIEITPYAPPSGTGGVSLTGNVYCITAAADLGGRAGVTLLVPASQPFPSAMYYASDRAASTWAATAARRSPPSRRC